MHAEFIHIYATQRYNAGSTLTSSWFNVCVHAHWIELQMWRCSKRNLDPVFVVWLRRHVPQSAQWSRVELSENMRFQSLWPYIYTNLRGKPEVTYRYFTMKSTRIYSSDSTPRIQSKKEDLRESIHACVVTRIITEKDTVSTRTMSARRPAWSTLEIWCVTS